VSSNSIPIYTFAKILRLMVNMSSNFLLLNATKNEAIEKKIDIFHVCSTEASLKQYLCYLYMIYLRRKQDISINVY
jgi:hypothetical protein